MGHTNNSIIIDAPYDRVFDISNDIPRWTELFGGEYTGAEVLSREGNRIEFKLTNREGQSWTSHRLLFKENRFAYAQKNEPTFPFKFMKIIWLYNEGEDGVQLTWIQDFELHPDFKAKTDDEVVSLINKHSQENLQIFKDIIEKEAKS